MPMIVIFIILAAVTSSARAQRGYGYPYGGYGYGGPGYHPPPVAFRGSVTLVSPAEATAAHAAASAGAGRPALLQPLPLPQRVSTAYSFGDRPRFGTAFDAENQLYDGGRASSVGQAHASLITRYQPVHDLPVEGGREGGRKYAVPAPYAKYFKPDTIGSPYSSTGTGSGTGTDRQFSSASSTSATYAETPRQTNLIRPSIYGYSYGSKYNNFVPGPLPPQYARGAVELGFYGKRPDTPGLQSLTSRGDISNLKIGFYRKT